MGPTGKTGYNNLFNKQWNDPIPFQNVDHAITGKTEHLGTFSFKEAIALVSNGERVAQAA